MVRKHTKVKQEYRVINIDIIDYDIIKKYCDKKSLKISKWVTQQIVNIIKQDKEYE